MALDPEEIVTMLLLAALVILRLTYAEFGKF